MIYQRLSDQQAALNMFILKWGYQIDPSRLEHYLSLGPDERIEFDIKFDFAIKHSPPNCAVNHFDCLTNYQQSENDINKKVNPWYSWLMGADSRV